MSINVIDFTEYPGLRHCNISDDSGEWFYHEVLNKKFKESYEKGEKLNVNLDGTAGYPPSFLDEAFGNLVYDFSLEIVQKFLNIISYEEPDLIELLTKETFPEWEDRRNKGEAPKKTTSHESWYIIKNGELLKK